MFVHVHKDTANGQEQALRNTRFVPASHKLPCPTKVAHGMRTSTLVTEFAWSGVEKFSAKRVRARRRNPAKSGNSGSGSECGQAWRSFFHPASQGLARAESSVVKFPVGVCGRKFSAGKSGLKWKQACPAWGSFHAGEAGHGGGSGCGKVGEVFFAQASQGVAHAESSVAGFRQVGVCGSASVCAVKL